MAQNLQAQDTQAGSKGTSITDTTSDDPKREEMKATNHATMDTPPTFVKDEAIATEKEAQVKGEEEDDMEYPHGLKLVLILLALCLSVFLVALDQTIISTAIPKITDHFNSIKDIGW